MTGPVPRGRQRAGGFGLLVLGVTMTAREWKTALGEGYYYPKAAVLFPAFAIIGLGLLFFPGYREERLARGERLEGLEGARLLTPRWWGILAVAIAVGVGHWWLISRVPFKTP